MSVNVIVHVSHLIAPPLRAELYSNVDEESVIDVDIRVYIPPVYVP